MTKDEMKEIDVLIQLATPLEDTEHSQTCGCPACGLLWQRASGLGHASRTLAAKVPALLAALRDATARAEKAEVSVKSYRAAFAAQVSTTHAMLMERNAEAQRADDAEAIARAERALRLVIEEVGDIDDDPRVVRARSALFALGVEP